jgi:mannosyltransferase
MTENAPQGRLPRRPALAIHGSGIGALVLFAAAATLYSFRLGSVSFGASEAYSVAAAMQPGVRQVVAYALACDPGKPPLYHLALHYLIRHWGVSEGSARTLSVAAALGSVMLVYGLSRAMFDSGVALAAALLWGFNPLTFMLAQWARMYTLFAALVVATLGLFWLVTATPPRLTWLAGLALSTAALLYVHMGGVLYVGTAGLLCLRDLARRRPGAWRVAAALGAGVLLFAPFVALELRQLRMLWQGHWLDWAGSGASGAAGARILAALIASAAVAAVLLAPAPRARGGDAVRLCLSWWLLPTVTLIAISLAIRPLLEPRYFAPAVPAATIVAAWLLMRLRRTPRQALFGATLGLFLVCFVFYQEHRRDTWRQVATLVAAARTPCEPIFFERGFVVRDSARGLASDAFPAGYYRLPFDLYYRGPDPQLSIDPSDPTRARRRIEAQAVLSRGAWLISGKPPQTAARELPQGAGWRVERRFRGDWLTVYHITPTFIRDAGFQDSRTARIDATSGALLQRAGPRNRQPVGKKLLISGVSSN